MSNKYSFASVVACHSDPNLQHYFVRPPNPLAKCKESWQIGRYDRDGGKVTENIAPRSSPTKGRLRLRSSSESLHHGPAATVVREGKADVVAASREISSSGSSDTSSLADWQFDDREPTSVIDHAIDGIIATARDVLGPAIYQQTLRHKDTFSSVDTVTQTPQLIKNPLSPSKLTLPIGLPPSIQVTQPLTPPLTPIAPQYAESIEEEPLSNFAISPTSSSSGSSHRTATFNPQPTFSYPPRIDSRPSPTISPMPQLSYPPSSPPSSASSTSSLDLRRPLSPLSPFFSLTIENTPLPDLDNLSLYSTDSAAPPPISLGIQRLGAGQHVCVPLSQPPPPATTRTTREQQQHYQSQTGATGTASRPDSGYSEGRGSVTPVPHSGPRLPVGAQYPQPSTTTPSSSPPPPPPPATNHLRQRHHLFSSLRAKFSSPFQPSQTTPQLSRSKSKPSSLLQQTLSLTRRSHRSNQQHQHQQRPILPAEWRREESCSKNGTADIVDASVSYPCTPPPHRRDSNATSPTTTTIPADAIRIRGREYPLSSLRPVSGIFVPEDSYDGEAEEAAAAAALAAGAGGGRGGRGLEVEGTGANVLSRVPSAGRKAQVVVIGGVEYEIRSGETREKVVRVLGG